MNKYCLDANAFIEPWSKYYQPSFVQGYWELLEELGREGYVFCPDQVKREIDKIDDGLKDWLNARQFFVREETIQVQLKVRDILKQFPLLISVGANRSMADPWVIAHALVEEAIVVSKEFLSKPEQRDSRVKIPDVCIHYGIPCITDFQFIKEIGVHFDARRSS